MKVIMENFRCNICDMNFRTLGKLSGEKRLLHHTETDHRASWLNCGKSFVSHSHASIHQFQCHDVLCVKCGKACEGRCLEEVVQKFENAGNRVMNKELEDVEMQIKESEEMYLNKFSGISEQQMKLLTDMIWWLLMDAARITGR